MTRKQGRSARGRKNAINNVRIVDKDEGTDDITTQRVIQAYNTAEGQIRVMCNYRTELSISTAITNGTVGVIEASTSDDFVSFSQQYQEFRIKAIRFDIYDLQPSSSTINFWSTFHQVGGVVPIGFEDVVDRPDSRAIAPGTGTASLSWVAHGIPEMSFQSTQGGATGFGGLSYYIGASPAAVGGKYSIIAKFVIDFRGRK